MTKEFVDYKTALALKELGFDEPCFGYYADKTGEDKTIYTVSQVQGSINSMSVHFNSGCSSYQFSAPLKQQAFRWFREKYNMHGNCELISSGWLYKTCNLKEYTIEHNVLVGKFKTYEEAEQTCLDKLIEICKNK